MTIVTAADYTARQTEAEFMATVREYAELRGWYCEHIPNAIINPIRPDLQCLRDGKCVFLELKTARGKLSSKQREMCRRYFEAGFPVLVVRPNDWPLIEATLW